MLVAVAVTLAARNPGDFSYWMSGLLVMPAGVLGAHDVEQRWPLMCRIRRVVVVGVSLALVATAGAWVLLDPGQRSYIIGSILCFPFSALIIPFILRDDDTDPAVTEGPWGPPPSEGSPALPAKSSDAKRCYGAVRRRQPSPPVLRQERLCGVRDARQRGPTQRDRLAAE